MTSDVATKKSGFGYTILYSLAVILTAQIAIPLFTEHYVVSCGVIVFALLMLLLDEFAVMPIVFLSAAGVMVTRSIAGAGKMLSVSGIWETGMPEFVFYIVYGVLLYILYNYVYAGSRYWALGFVLVIPDFLANIAELYIRIGSDIGHAKTILILLLVAVVRSAIVLIIYKVVIRMGLKIVRMPRSGVEVVDGKAHRVHPIKHPDDMLSSAADDAMKLYHKLEVSGASPEVISKAKSLAADIDRASKN